jgi:hypothetical protein
MSDEAICGAQNRDGDPCQQKAGWGTDHVGEGRCKFHGGASDGAPEGNDNALTHGGHSTDLPDDLEDHEREFVEQFMSAIEADDAEAVLAALAAEAIVRYRRSENPRQLTEARQLLSEFNIVENVDKQEITGDLLAEFE